MWWPSSHWSAPQGRLLSRTVLWHSHMWTSPFLSELCHPPSKLFLGTVRQPLQSTWTPNLNGKLLFCKYTSLPWSGSKNLSSATLPCGQFPSNSIWILTPHTRDVRPLLSLSASLWCLVGSPLPSRLPSLPSLDSSAHYQSMLIPPCLPSSAHPHSIRTQSPNSGRKGEEKEKGRRKTLLIFLAQVTKTFHFLSFPFFWAKCHFQFALERLMPESTLLS